jgi:hypothetical protein
MIFEPKDLRNVAKWSSVVWEVHYITGSETPLDKDVIVGRLVLSDSSAPVPPQLERGRPTDNLQEQFRGDRSCRPSGERKGRM